ncbi:MAG: LCP family protein [Propionibacteriaceae bacterium]|nr:LCP family protein [Propionibacteriaceae bacterium]
MSDGRYSGDRRDGSPRHGINPESTQRRPRRSAPDDYTPTPRHVMPTPEPELGKHATPPVNDDIFRRPSDDPHHDRNHDRRHHDDPAPRLSSSRVRHARDASQSQSDDDPQIDPTRSSLRRSLLLTTGSALLPGLGLIGAKPRWAKLLGVLAPLTFLTCLGIIGYTAVTDLPRLAGIALNPNSLIIVTALMVTLALSWVMLVTATHLLTRPPGMRTGRRALGAFLVTALTFCIGAPLAVGARYALSNRDLVDAVFKNADEIISTSRPTIIPGNNPWKDIPRLNILLLGADSTAVRTKDNKGVYVPRTDTIMVASIDTATGATTLIQIPRNVQYTPFPKGSKLAQLFPKGFTSGQGGDGEWFVNAIWERTVSGDRPDMTKAVSPATYPGAEALKQGVEGITGLHMHYFALINIDGLQQLIDAMGGVTVNINKKLPIGGSESAGIKPHGYLKPGPNQRLDGYHAMWYARGRYRLGDYDRMARQSCLVGSIIRQANPQTMLTSYEAIAKASKDMVMTDIPQEVLQPIVELALKVKDANVTRLRFDNGAHGYNYDRPDFPEMRKSVQEALGITVETTPSPTPTAAPSPETSAPVETQPTTAPPKSEKSSKASQPATPTETEPPPAEVVSDACAYNPEE